MASRKRRLSEITVATTDATPGTTPAVTTHFRLLDLAAELRNNIYEKLLEDTAIEIRSSPAVSRKQLKRRQKEQTPIKWQELLRLPPQLSSLALLNKQVHDEVLYIALTAVPLHTTVSNANFSHVVTFLNKLGDTELDRLASREKSQELHIWLDVSTGTLPGRGLMARWLHRMDVSTKKGTNIDYIYHANIASLDWLWRRVVSNRYVHLLEHILNGRKKLDDSDYGQRAQEEGRKILQAFKGPWKIA